MPPEKIECNRWSYADLDEKYLQKFKVWHSVPASGAHRSCRLMSLAAKGVYISLKMCVMCALFILPAEQCFKWKLGENVACKVS